jgi:TP901 family phage tail tape measure protein
MASRIKGITVEIGGDTTGLDKALSGVDKEIKDTSKNLKDVNKLLKFDPKNTTLLKQKQELLGKQIGSTKDRLNTLKEADKQAKKQMEAGELGKDKYDALQREIEETKTELKSLQSQKIKLDTKGLNDFATGAEDAGKKLSVVSGAIAGIGTAAISAAKDLDSGYDTIVKATGATGEALEGLKDVANNVYTSMDTDMDTVGAAVGEINTKFGSTGDEAENLTKKFIKFADITDSDVTSSIDSAYDIMQKWNMTQDDTMLLLDQIAGVAQDTGIGVNELFTAITDNADTLKQLNIDASSAVGLMAQLEKAGIDSATGLKAMKTAAKNATSSGKAMDDFLSENITAMLNAKNQTEALSIATDIFGNKNAATMLSALQDGRLNLDELSNSMTAYAGKVDQTYADTQDPWNEMNVAINNVKLAGAELGADLAEKLVPIIEALIEKVQSVISWWDGLSQGQKDMIETVALVVAAIGPLILIISKVIIGVLSLASATAALNISMLPIIAVVAAIIAIVAAVIIVIKNWGKISDWIKKKFAQLKTALNNIWNSIKSVIVNVVIGIKNKVISIFTAVVTGIKNIVSKITGTVKAGFDGAISFITSLPGKALGWGKDFIQGLIDGIKKMVNKVKDTVKGVADKIKSFLHFSRPDEGPLRDYESWMPDFMEGLASGITDNMYKVREAIKDVSGIMNLEATVKGGNGMSLSNINTTLVAILKSVKEGKIIKLDRREVGRIKA